MLFCSLNFLELEFCRHYEAEGLGSAKPSNEEQPTVFVGEQYMSGVSKVGVQSETRAGERE